MLYVALWLLPLPNRIESVSVSLYQSAAVGTATEVRASWTCDEGILGLCLHVDAIVSSDRDRAGEALGLLLLNNNLFHVEIHEPGPVRF